jgi:hypothetical protein
MSETDEIIEWAARLGVTPEELRSAIQKGGTPVKEVLDELRRRGLEPPPARSP